VIDLLAFALVFVAVTSVLHQPMPTVQGDFMKQTAATAIFALVLSLLTSACVYHADPGPGRGGHCPPGQAKKGNC
jgi:cbb3-type cytochrome oxidase subunit 3